MKVYVKQVATDTDLEASILSINKKDFPLRKDGWQFNWKKLAQTEAAWFYKLALQQSPTKVEGMLMLTLVNNEMVYMNTIEVAPHNYGKAKIYDDVAACLIAFACEQSFQLGKKNYNGFLVFDSKTELIPLYQNKYGATRMSGQRMFIDATIGKMLTEKYLNYNK